MNIKFETPSVVVVTESKKFFNEYKSIVEKEHPGLKFFQVGKEMAYKHFPKFNESFFEKEGYDIWIPRESVKKLNRAFRRKISGLIR